jgi:hypothetical protein
VIAKVPERNGQQGDGLARLVAPMAARWRAGSPLEPPAEREGVR